MYKFKSPDLTLDQVKTLYTSFKTNEYSNYLDLWSYYKGQNKDIINKSVLGVKEKELSKIPVPYARKIINTVVGYMYHSKAVTYSYVNDKEKTIFQDINDANDENVLIGELGKKSSIYGVAYEIIYANIDKDINLRLHVPDSIEIIPFYDYSIDPKLLGYLRWIQVGEEVNIDMYTETTIRHFVIDKDSKFTESASDPNVLNVVPLSVYKNNFEQTGDFECVLKLIEAYDNLISSCNDELKRWALAYLLAFGIKFEKEQIEQMKENRAISGMDKNTDDVRFLTKPVDAQFITTMKDWLREEINLQTHVPDFLKLRTGEASSGASIDRLLYDFEFICAVKESYFRKGLYNRLELIGSIKNIADPKKLVTIKFERNKPSDSTINAQLFNQYYGKLSDVTVIKNFATFVEDPEAEINAAQEEKQGRLEAYSDFAFGNKGDSASGDSEGDSGKPEKKPVFVA
jgi:SPP1 family phage portal protein